MKLDELLRNVPCTAIKGPTDLPVAGIAYDSRQVRQDYLFVAIPGGQRDGMDFADEAVRRGARAIVSASGKFAPKEATHIQVRNVRRALAEIADAFYGHPSTRLCMVGITGTNGKTTTAFLVRDMLAAAGRAPGLIGTVQYEVGARILPASRTTPESADLQGLLDQMLHAGCRSVSMEVSSHALDQDRAAGVDFDAAVFTNLTRDHLDYHETMGRYFEAKRKLFLSLGKGTKQASAIINVDDSWGKTLIAYNEISANIVTYGFGPEAVVRAEDVRPSGKGSEFRIASPWGESRLQISLLGRFNVYNALAAYAVGRALGLDEHLVVESLAARRTVPGRLEEIPTDRRWRVFVDYAHTDDALENALRTLRSVTPGRLVVVFGCGGNRDQTKRPMMGAVAAQHADFSVLTSDNPRREDPLAILEQISAGFGSNTNFTKVEDRKQAIREALGMAREGDTVLIAGKGHETTQEFANTIVPFDDRKVAGILLREFPE